jgi:hypothetical protein
MQGSSQRSSGAGSSARTIAFANWTKLSADGSNIVYSTYLRGHASMESYFDYAAEPSVFLTQNWISAIALDAAGNATVAGDAGASRQRRTGGRLCGDDLG